MVLVVDTRYPLSFPYGLLKLVQIVCSFAAIITYLLMKNWAINWKGFIIFTCVGCLVCSLLMLLVYMLRCDESLACPWVLVELIHCCVWAVLSLVTFAVCVHYTGKYGAGNLTRCMTAIAVFMGAACIAYIINAVLLTMRVRCWRTTTTATGGGTTTTRTTVTRTVRY